MEEFPILIGGLEVGKVVIQKPTDAIRTARDSAFTISTTNDTRFCPFSDGSHNKDRGGVGLVYRRNWLPKEWAPEQPTGPGPSDHFFQISWPYARSSGNMVMEGIGVLEGLHAANETIRRDLHVLKAQTCTIIVRGTTDCEAILRHIARNGPIKAKAERTVPSQLIKRIRIEIQQLSSHGVKVNVELHWCPRNKVLPLLLADKLAGRAMANGFGFTNVKHNRWVWAMKSDMTLDIEPLVCGAPRSDQTADAQEPPAAGPSTTGKSRKERKERWRAERAANVATAASIPQLQLPSLPLPSKPAMNTPATQVPNEPVTAEAAKRKVEEDEKEKENNEKPTKKAKSSAADEAKTRPAAPKLPSAPRARPRQKQIVPTMPAAWALDPEVTTTYIYGPGGHTQTHVPRCPFIREVLLSTMETREKNIFVNDGVNLFSMAKPMRVYEGGVASKKKSPRAVSRALIHRATALWKFVPLGVFAWETIPLGMASQEGALRKVIK